MHHVMMAIYRTAAVRNFGPYSPLSQPNEISYFGCTHASAYMKCDPMTLYRAGGATEIGS